MKTVGVVLGCVVKQLSPFVSLERIATGINLLTLLPTMFIVVCMWPCTMGVEIAYNPSPVHSH